MGTETVAGSHWTRLWATSPRRMIAGVLAAVLAVLSVACGVPPSPPPAPVGPGALSLGNGGVFGEAATSAAAISADGNVVAFASAAENLVPGDSNGLTDTFVRNRANGEVVRVAPNTVDDPKISRNGRWVSYVAFGGTYGVYDRYTGTHRSWNTVAARNTPIVPDDGSVAIYGRTSSLGIFATSCIVRDLDTGTESDCPHQGPGYGTVALDAVSGNGRFVLYYWLDQDGGGTSGRFVWDRTTGEVRPAPEDLVVLGDSVAISDDGNHIAATDLFSGSVWSAQLFDLEDATVESLPVEPDGHAIPRDLTADGGVVVILSEAENLVGDDTNGTVDIYLWHTDTGELEAVSRRIDDPGSHPVGATECGTGPGSITANGDGVCVLTDEALLAQDTNGVLDAWLVPG